MSRVCARMCAYDFSVAINSRTLYFLHLKHQNIYVDDEPIARESEAATLNEKIKTALTPPTPVYPNAWAKNRLLRAILLVFLDDRHEVAAID